MVVRHPTPRTALSLDLTGHESVGLDSSAAARDNYVTIKDTHLDNLTLTTGNALLSVTLVDSAAARFIDARSSSGSGAVNVTLGNYTAFRSGQAIFLTDNDDRVTDGDGATNVTFGAGKDTFIDGFAHGIDKLLDFNIQEDTLVLRLDDLSRTFDPTASNPIPSPFVRPGDSSGTPLSLLSLNTDTIVQTFTGAGEANTNTTFVALKGKNISIH